MKTPADSTLAKGVPTDGRAKKFRSQKLLLIFIRLVAVERLIDGRAVVDDFANGEEHRDGGIRLEDIASHIDAGGALVDRVLRELERVAFRQFLAARDHDRDRARVRNLLELLVAVVRLNDVGAVRDPDRRSRP